MKITKILIVILIAAATSLTPLHAKTKSAKKVLLIRDGFYIDGAEGSVKQAPDKDTWFFSPDENIIDGKAVLKAGDQIQLLPSSTLEKITANINPEAGLTGVRLWAQVTKYKNKNFLFAGYFIPMSQIEETKADAPPPEEKDPQPAQAPPDQAEPTDKKPAGSIIPDDVMAILKPKRTVDFARVKETPDIKNDTVLVGRAGYLNIKEDNKVFQIDGFGRNAEALSFPLLPCEVLELAEMKMARPPARQRYQIAGVVTKYKGRLYLLPQKAARTYSHGNFAR